MFHRKLSIRQRVLSLVGSAMVVMVCFLGALTFLEMKVQLRDDLEDRAVSIAKTLSQSIPPDLESGDTAVVAEVIHGTMASQANLKEIWITDLRGTKLYYLLREGVEQDNWDTLLVANSTVVQEDATCLVVGQPMTLKDRLIGSVWLRIGKESMLARIRQSIIIIVLAGTATLLLFMFPVLILSRRIVRPLKTLESAASRISKGFMSSPIDISELTSDFTSLGDAFNRMQATLGETIGELEKSRHELEDRVLLRTAELEIEVAERRKAEESLRDREGLLAATLEATGDGILVVSNDGKATHWNASFVKLWQIPDEVIATQDDSQLLGFVLSQLKDPNAFLEKVKALYMSTDESFDLLEFADGRAFERYSRPLVKDNQILGRVWSFRDISRRRNAEQEQTKLRDQLERAQRMESLGLLAGGVAHDLNNMLGPVVGYSELLVRELPPDSRAATRAKRIGKSAEEAAVVIQDLLTLARRGRCELHPIDFNGVISTYLESPGFEKLKERCPGVAVNVELSPTAGAIMGSEPHLGKVIMNLITNAFEAMPTGGQLLIKTDRVQIDKLYSGYHKIDPGDYVVFETKDTGSGIAPEDISKIFEPYFSKKKMGQSGSGLGLSVVYGIVKDHGGYYDIRSQLGQGTEFILYFPVSDKAIKSADSSVAKEIIGGHESVLVIDDDVNQRDVAVEIIGSLGYNVHSVATGRAAVEYLRRQPVDLILLDMIMEPDFDGLDTYRKILSLWPGQKAIVASGFSSTDRVQAVLDLGAGEFIRKPFKIGLVAKAIRAVLDNPEQAETGFRSLAASGV